MDWGKASEECEFYRCPTTNAGPLSQKPLTRSKRSTVSNKLHGFTLLESPALMTALPSIIEQLDDEDVMMNVEEE